VRFVAGEAEAITFRFHLASLHQQLHGQAEALFQVGRRGDLFAQLAEQDVATQGLVGVQHPECGDSGGGDLADGTGAEPGFLSPRDRAALLSEVGKDRAQVLRRQP